MIDDNTLFEYIGGIFSAGISWFLLMIRGDARDARKAVVDLEKSTNEKISKLTDNFAEYRIFLATTIPTKVEMNAAILDTKESVKRINERLDEISDNLMEKRN